MSKKLVAYFSASGVTARLAHTLTKAVGADLFEIQPKQLYTDKDLDWRNENSRSSVEMKDKTSRPQIANSVENIAQYDTIFVGFPIWWYVAPTIINTFLEQYDLSGKKIIPFATSGGSGMGKTNSELQNSCSGANLCEGKRFSANASESDLSAWAKQFDV